MQDPELRAKWELEVAERRLAQARSLLERARNEVRETGFYKNSLDEWLDEEWESLVADLEQTPSEV